MKTYIMCSGGKDSVATCILAKEHNIRVDAVVFSEFMFSIKDNIPAEHPIQYEWKHKVLIPRLKEMGFDVVIVSPNTDYITLFNRGISKSAKNKDRVGKKQGFVIGNLCYVKRDLKVNPINKWVKQQGKFNRIVGYAYDEIKRIEIMKKEGWRSLLYEYKVKEIDAFNICRNYGLLSPMYEHQFRDGCWFCPNASIKEFARLKKDYPYYWEKLKELSLTENLVSNKFKYDMTFSQVDKQIMEINNQVTMFDLIEDKGE